MILLPIIISFIEVSVASSRYFSKVKLIRKTIVYFFGCWVLKVTKIFTEQLHIKLESSDRLASDHWLSAKELNLDFEVFVNLQER